jgi:hypothetical protein
MRLAWVAWLLVSAGCVLFPGTELGGAVVAAAGVALLPVLGYRDGTWRALKYALIVPAAALAADVVTFTPWSFQPDTDAVIFTGAALYYVPVWALLVAAGIGARRLRRSTAEAG